MISEQTCISFTSPENKECTQKKSVNLITLPFLFSLILSSISQTQGKKSSVITKWQKRL